MTAPSAGPLSPPSTVILRATRTEAPGASLKVAGLSVVERSVRQLSRAPQLRIIVATDGAVTLPAPSLRPNVEVRAVASERDAQALVSSLSRELPGALVLAGDVVRRQGEPLDGGIRVVDEVTRRRAEDGVFADLLRGDLGFIARHLNKKISFRVTRYVLCKLPITPNQVTLGAAVVGVFGCIFIASGSAWGAVTGFLLAQVQSILDGCDGELARVRFQQSALGEWLDTVVDDCLNFLLVASMGLGLWRAGHGWPAVAASAAACFMLLFYNVVAYRELVRQGVGGEVLKIRWKLARGIDMKSLMSEGDRRRGIAQRATRALLALGRKDVFIFSWLVLAALKQLPMALFWAVVIALSCFVTALGQLLTREPAPP